MKYRRYQSQARSSPRLAVQVADILLSLISNLLLVELFDLLHV